jgi:hypothetical protein
MTTTDWPSVYIESWEALVSRATHYMNGGSFMYRGQANSSSTGNRAAEGLFGKLEAQ